MNAKRISTRRPDLDPCWSGKQRRRPGTDGAQRHGFHAPAFATEARIAYDAQNLYRPASTLFVVWTQSRDQGDRDFGSFTATRDYKNLFAARPDNVFLIKAAYWLGRRSPLARNRDPGTE